MADIFSPKTIRHTKIKNRIVLPPLVTFNFSENGFVNQRKLDHYKAIAENGIGMIVVEATAINPKGRLSNDQLGIWDDTFIEGLSQLADTIHMYNCTAIIQIHHAGAKTRYEGAEDIISASAYKGARAMTLEEIKANIEDFKAAALRAEKAGFDGVEIHGAHGYLLTQFFSKTSNQRQDAYGGNLENRLRIAKDIIQAIRPNVNKDFIIGIRMGANENDLDTAIKMATYFESLSYDYLSVSTGLDARPIEKPEDFPYHWIVYGGTVIKKAVHIPVIGVYKLRFKEDIEGLIGPNLLDFVAVGRGQLADYQFTEHIKAGKDLLYCLECQPCQWRYDGMNCPRQRQSRKKI